MKNMISQVYVASHDSNGGIHHYILFDSGHLELINSYILNYPTYISSCINGHLYVLLRESFPNQSGIATFTISSDGSLFKHGPVQSTKGSVASCILIIDNAVYCTNYGSGTTILFPNKIVSHVGKGPDPIRQKASHPHCIVPTPDGEYLCIADLGTDNVYIFNKNMDFISSIKLPGASGPRHIVFSDNNSLAYCVNELSSTVSILSYYKGYLEYVSSYSTLPKNCFGKNTAAAIRLHKNRLYVSNRGNDSIAIFDIFGSKLYPLCFPKTGGSSPRDFNIIDDLLLCGNELSDNITIFRITDNGISDVKYSISVKRPWCILPLK